MRITKNAHNATFNLEKYLCNIESAAIETALAVTNGNLARAAKILGIKRTTLSERCKRIGIDVDDFRDTFYDDGTSLEVLPDKAVKLRKVTSFGMNSPLRMLVISTVIDSLRANDWNRTHTAKELGISLRTVRYYIIEAKQLGMEVQDSKPWLKNKE